MAEPLLQQRIRLFDATTLVVGSMIGSGIFLMLPIMAREVPSPGWLLGLWVVGGLFAVFGANACAELAAMMPRAGGQYVFIREAFGDLWAFLFGWTQFLIIQTGTNAAVALAFAKYLGSLVPRCGEKHVLAEVSLKGVLPATLVEHVPQLAAWQLNSAQLVGCGVIVLLTAVNIRGLREGVWVQNVFTVLKVAALVALIVAGLWFALDHGQVIAPSPPVGESLAGVALLAGLAAALSKVLFAYDAWYTVTFTAEEVHDSGRTLPRSLLLGTVIVTIIYVLANWAYLAVLPLEQIVGMKKDDDRVAQFMGAAVFGEWGATLVIVAVLVSTFGCLNGLILGGARVCYAMAREGFFLRSCAHLRPGAGTPDRALVYQGIVSIVLALSGSYSALVTCTTFAAVFFTGLMVAAVYRLRVTRPDLHRPYRCWGYPVTPGLYLALSAPFLVYVIVGAAVPSGIALVLMLSGLPFYAVWRARNRAAAGTPGSGIL